MERPGCENHYCGVDLLLTTGGVDLLLTTGGVDLLLTTGGVDLLLTTGGVTIFTSTRQQIVCLVNNSRGAKFHLCNNEGCYTLMTVVGVWGCNPHTPL